MLKKIVNYKDPGVREFAADHPNTPAEALKKLFFISSSFNKHKEEILNQIAMNPNTPEEVLMSFWKGKNEVLKSNVLVNPSFPIQRILKDIDKQKKEIKCLILKHSNIPIKLLDRWCSKSDINLKAAIAENSVLNKEIFYKLLNEKNDHVIICLARNTALRNTSLDAILNISKGKNIFRDILINYWERSSLKQRNTKSEFYDKLEKLVGICGK